ncbi:class I SAM-dependent methyltransferase [Micromonospora sp. NPDC018662]|uniref:class I SAM-dependent methyltransferase n=1 Tax=Micromonospora sp. NPDC018662 TaxID=3364238 RepID=UPI0037BD1984
MNQPTLTSDAPQPSGPPGQLDMSALMSFMQRFVADVSAAGTVVMCAIGSRLGLFAELVRSGPATAAELADRTGTRERYVREWALALATAGYLTRDGDGRYALPPGPAAALGDADGPFYMGDMARLMPALSAVSDRVIDGFRTGAGLHPEEYPAELFETVWHKDANRLGKVLVRQWVMAVDGLTEQLRVGGRVAQVHCGDGRALILLAQAFPRLELVGYDPVEINIRRARAEAAAAGVADRIRFSTADPAEDLGDGFALVLAIDVLHEAPDPAALLRRIHDALQSHGVFLLLATNGEDVPPAGPNPVSSMLYAISTLQHVPQGLAAGVADPAGLMGLPPALLDRLCTEAGFTTVERLMEPSPFNTLYELRA